jgi:hypothetical protein
MWKTANGKDRDRNVRIPQLPEIGHRVVVPNETETKTVLTIEWDIRHAEAVVYIILT